MNNPTEKLEKNERHARRMAGRRNHWFGRIAWRLLKLLLVCLMISSVAVYLIYRSAQSKPEFYQRALEQPREQLVESGGAFEQRILDIQNAAHDEGAWETVFTATQINGWLAVDMPRKFPGSLPRQMKDPRVGLEPDEIQFACQFKTTRLSGVVVAKANVFRTDRENEIGIRIYGINSGVIPIPISRFAKAISTALRNEGIDVSWSDLDGDPVALIDLPRDVTEVEDDKRVILDDVVVEQGQIVLRGRTVAR